MGGGGDRRCLFEVGEAGGEEVSVVLDLLGNGGVEGGGVVGGGGVGSEGAQGGAAFGGGRGVECGEDGAVLVGDALRVDKR